MTMKKANGLGLLLAVVCAAFLLSGCSRAKEPVSPNSSRREAITFMAPYRDIDNFIDTVHKTYPEVNIEVIPDSGIVGMDAAKAFFGTFKTRAKRTQNGNKRGNRECVKQSGIGI